MFFLALKQMLSKKKQTMLIFLGISFGTMIYILVAGLQLGMRQFMIEQLLNNTAHILISGEESFIDADEVQRHFYNNHIIKWVIEPSGKRKETKLNNTQAWFQFLEKNPYVLSYSPRYTMQAIGTNTKYKASINLVGMIPQKQVRVSGLEDYMTHGSILDIKAGTNTIILSSKLLKNLGAKVGSTINISNGLYDSLPFKIIGTIHLGNEQIDSSFALAHLKDVQKLDQSPGRISEIAIALHDMEYSIPLAKQWSLISRDKVQSWQEANKAFMEVIMIQDLFRYIITATILLVAGFGIYNVLSIMINQKQKEIAILRSIGYGSKKVLELFFIQGIILGSIGGLFGIGLGYMICQIIGHIELSFEIGKSNYLWISYDPLIYLVGFLAAFCASIIAGLFPSYRASQLTPLEIIRANS